MSYIKRIYPEIPPRTRAVFGPLAALFLLVAILAGAISVEAADQSREDPVHRYRLGTELSAHVQPRGGLILLTSDSSLPLLRTELISGTDFRRRRDADTFYAVVVDGVQGGHRGFSSRADDDGDGITDEDPLDGMDNDRDGTIDEDFAAVSDAMVVFHLSEPQDRSRGLQLEYYHWATPRLSSAVFVNAGGGTGSGGTYRIESPGPGWQEATVRSLRHTVTGRTEQEEAVALVCRASLDDPSFNQEPCDPDQSPWLGVMILDENSSARFLVERGRLDLTLDETPVPLVICAADSWMQLNRILGEARSVFDGMVDPVDNRRARWIVPPFCSACRTAGPPVFDLKTGPEGGFTLTADLVPGKCGLLDPDLFQIGGRSLGAPREIRWVPAGGEESSIAWSCLTADRLRDASPDPAALFPVFSDLQGHQAMGRLEYIFGPPVDALTFGTAGLPQPGTEVIGRYLDGRGLRALLADRSLETPEFQEGRTASLNPAPDEVEETARRYAEDRTRILNSNRHQFRLSPDLLMGWPNPFSDIISIKFKVPRTMKEAFVWKDNELSPTEIDFEGDVPWTGGQPGVSVKIYSINGQELVTLHSANQGVGEYTVQWNGTDAFGRKVASGTYFCKLQMDDWSVTRRLVFIR